MARVKLTIATSNVKAAKRWVKDHHSKLPDLHAALFAVGVEADGVCVCIAVVALPGAPAFQTGRIAEIVRVASDGTAPHACSMAYAAARRMALEGGYRRIVTYTHLNEPGVGLKAAGFWPTALTRGEERDRKTRRRKKVVDASPKIRWEAGPDAAPLNREVAELVPGWSKGKRLAA